MNEAPAVTVVAVAEEVKPEFVPTPAELKQLLDPRGVLTRQLDILPPEKMAGVPLTIIGSGSVGSFTALTLAKMGFNTITIYDDDIIEPQNLSNQFYRQKDLFYKKTHALTLLIEEFTGVKVTPVQFKFGHEGLGGYPQAGIYVIATDNMDARKQAWGMAKQWPLQLWVDARMGAEVLRLFTVKPQVPTDVIFYEKHLYSSAEAVQEPCTARTIIYTVNMAAGLIAMQLKRHLMEQKYPLELTHSLKDYILLPTWK